MSEDMIIDALQDFRKSVADENKPSPFKVEVGEMKSPIEMIPASEALKNAGDITLMSAKKLVDYLVTEKATMDFRVVLGAVNASVMWLLAIDPHQRMDPSVSIAGVFAGSGLTALTAFFATESVRLRSSKSTNT